MFSYLLLKNALWVLLVVTIVTTLMSGDLVFLAVSLVDSLLLVLLSLTKPEE